MRLNDNVWESASKTAVFVKWHVCIFSRYRPGTYKVFTFNRLTATLVVHR